MANVLITPNKSVSRNEFVEMPALTALSALGDKYIIDFSGAADGQILVRMDNSAATAATVTIAAGDSIMGTCDLTISVPANSAGVAILDSMIVKNTLGINKGKIVAQVSALTCKVGAVIIPK